MKKIDSLDVVTINFIASPILYLSILLPIAIKHPFTNLIPIVMLIHNILFWSFIVYVERKK